MKNILTLALLAPMLSLFSCKKDTTITTSPADYTAKMSGTRKWHGTHNGWVLGHDSLNNETSPEFNRSLNDSSVTISVSGTTISFWNMTLQLDSTNTSTHTMHYSENSVPNISCNVTYYYAADSIYCDYVRNDGHAGVTYIKMRTP